VAEWLIAPVSKTGLRRACNVGSNPTLSSVPVAQSNRVFGFEPKGWGFESLRALQFQSKEFVTDR
jgi:hypothetical protein